jgi:selenocysteine lyase/cysteine desulfurase
MTAGTPGFADRFDGFDGWAYLAAASQGPLPLASARAGREALKLKEQPWRMSTATHLSAVREVRALAARLLGAREESVALLTGAGGAVNVAARGLTFAPGDEVLLPRHEFPANDLPWRWLAGQGVQRRVVEPDHASGAVSAARLAAEVGPRTRVVAFSHVSYLHGGRIDPAPVVEAARKVGALTVVDGSQAAGALPFDFGASGVDVYAVAGYKYLLGPVGTGLGLFSPSALSRLAVGDVNWTAVAGSENLSALDALAGEVAFRPGALRYDVHETAAYFNLLPLAESLRLVSEVTPAAVQAHVRGLLDRILARLPRGWEPASPLELDARSHILCLRGPGTARTEAAFEALQAARVWTSLRSGRIRVAPHLYNGAADIERLLAVLEEHSEG